VFFRQKHGAAIFSNIILTGATESGFAGGFLFCFETGADQCGRFDSWPPKESCRQIAFIFQADGKKIIVRATDWREGLAF